MTSVSGKNAIRISLPFVLFAMVAGCGTSARPDPSDPNEEGESVPIPELTPAEKAELEQFYEPVLTLDQELRLLAKYQHIDPQGTVPPELLKKALTYFEANKERLPNPNFITIIDFRPHSSHSRFFIVNVKTGEVETLHTAHGEGSDTNDDGLAASYSNTPGSRKSSLGYYRTAETYYGKHGLSLRLDGLSSTNSNVRARAIVIHGAKYVKEASVKQGLSWGCPAITMSKRSSVVNALKEGSLIYAGLSG
jgi:hypothetical protein